MSNTIKISLPYQVPHISKFIQLDKEMVILIEYLKNKSSSPTPLWPDWSAKFYTCCYTANGQTAIVRLIPMDKGTRGS